jgi:hypothetical protein
MFVKSKIYGGSGDEFYTSPPASDPRHLRMHLHPRSDLRGHGWDTYPRIGRGSIHHASERRFMRYYLAPTPNPHCNFIITSDTQEISVAKATI